MRIGERRTGQEDAGAVCAYLVSFDADRLVWLEILTAHVHLGQTMVGSGVHRHGYAALTINLRVCYYTARASGQVPMLTRMGVAVGRSSAGLLRRYLG